MRLQGKELYCHVGGMFVAVDVAFVQDSFCLSALQMTVL